MSTNTKLPSAELERTVMLGQHSVTLAKTEGGGTVLLRGPDGSEALCIEITAQGAKLHLARGLAIAVEGHLSFEAESVAIRGRQALSFESQGDASIAVKGHMSTSSRSNTIATTHGDVSLDANDDIVMRGERVRVNC